MQAGRNKIDMGGLGGWGGGGLEMSISAESLLFTAFFRNIEEQTPGKYNLFQRACINDVFEMC